MSNFGTCPICNTNAVILKGKDKVCGDCLFKRIAPDRDPKTSTSPTVDQAAQKSIDYLYTIKGDVSTETAILIGLLRQLINEEFVAKHRQVNSQMIYDTLKKVLK